MSKHQKAWSLNILKQNLWLELKSQVKPLFQSLVHEPKLLERIIFRFNLSRGPWPIGRYAIGMYCVIPYPLTSVKRVEAQIIVKRNSDSGLAFGKGPTQTVYENATTFLNSFFKASVKCRGLLGTISLDFPTIRQELQFCST